MAKPRGRGLWIAVAAVLLSAGLAVWGFTRPVATLAPNPPGPRLSAAAQGLDDVTIDAVFDPLYGSVLVRQSLTLQNRTGETQRLLVLRTYPNALQSEDTSPAATDELYDACYPEGFSAGSLTVTQMRVTLPGGAEQSPAYAYGDTAQTVLRVSLPGDWLPGQKLTLQMQYTLQVPTARWRTGQSGGVWALGNAFAIPSPFLDGAYRTDDAVSIGEPFLSECRNYTVRLTAPDGYAVAGTGTPTVESDADGQRVTRFDAPAARDFALYLNASPHTAQALQDGVLVRAFANADGDARTMLTFATRALACFNARYGAYPYPVLNLCAVDLPTGGTAYPGMVWVTPAELARADDAPEQQVAMLVARQWWAEVIGVDGFRQAWQADALSMFSLLDYWETQHGQDARAELTFALTDTAMRLTIPRGVTPGSPLTYFGDWTEFRLVVTNRGAAALCALDTAMGGALDGFLRTYYDTFAFDLATRDDFETLLARETGQDWSPLLSDYLDTYIDN